MFVSKKFRTTGNAEDCNKTCFLLQLYRQSNWPVPKLAYDSSFFDASIGFSHSTAWPANAVLANKC